MNDFSDQIEQLINKQLETILANSSTYKEAIIMNSKCSALTPQGVEIKKVIQSRITELALNNLIVK
ncbi:MULTISPECIES: hypothetical protein [unclassified Lactococcus]|uniref:hypothetical protein n=1 Tax=unclassified Lactococcus TaxID=2643510 RepID=UPI0011C750E5|nr:MULTISPECIES: hypothetical protein [unclassified Lactococcus]MQW23730.1 hypothetical protein [Lactococcus sp. dk101]TXK37475.1 hypothetical protein FVP42_08915 [Lactococcus sp. dk310]TXK48818.1 hypothetical protein FVP43_08890 [Lactococcus sp. dk322]